MFSVDLCRDAWRANQNQATNRKTQLRTHTKLSNSSMRCIREHQRKTRLPKQQRIFVDWSIFQSGRKSSWYDSSRPNSKHQQLGNYFIRRIFLKMVHSQPLFLYFCLFYLIYNWYIKLCRCWDSNRGSLLLEATTLPTEPPPLPSNTNSLVSNNSWWRAARSKSWKDL